MTQAERRVGAEQVTRFAARLSPFDVIVLVSITVYHHKPPMPPMQLRPSFAPW